MTELYDSSDALLAEESDEAERAWTPLAVSLHATAETLHWPSWGQAERWWDGLQSEHLRALQALDSAETDIWVALSSWGPVTGFAAIPDHERALIEGPLTWPQWNIAKTTAQEENEENG